MLADDAEREGVIVNAYAFSTSETSHAKAIGETFRRTRMLRRALLHKLTGREYAEMPADQLLQMSTADLMKELNVELEKQRFQVRPNQAGGMRYEARGRQAAHMFPGGYGPGSRSRKAKLKGLPMNGGAYGYERNAQGRFIPEDGMRQILKDSFAIAAEMNYTEAGRYLNELGVPTPTGLTWGKDTARDFFRNTIYAGYVRELAQNAKRGPIRLYPAWQVEAVIDLREWIDANRRYAYTHNISFPIGFLNPEDRETWQAFQTERAEAAHSWR